MDPQKVIIAKAPLRVSYLGGGSDYESFFQTHTGVVFGTTIEQYVYTIINPLQKFASEKFRFTYRKTESVLDCGEFDHPVVREVLKNLNWQNPINIATMSDVPGNSGLGSSSAFTVSLLAALNCYLGLEPSPSDLAVKAIQIERHILLESGGVQDQFHSAIGGFRKYVFSKNKTSHSKNITDPAIKNYISDRQWLLRVGDARNSSDLAKNFHLSEGEKVSKQKLLADAALSYWSGLEKTNKPEDFYNLLCESIKVSWDIKSKFGSVSNSLVQAKVDFLLSSGVDSVKLCGAGGSGFLLFMTQPDNIEKIVKECPQGWVLPARIEDSGVGLTEI
jgi:D-glycero-alpha-D-manno-heptose-7-phosphate kinase